MIIRYKRNNNEFKAAGIEKVKALPEAEYNATVEFQRQLSAPVQHVDPLIKLKLIGKMK